MFPGDFIGCESASWHPDKFPSWNKWQWSTALLLVTITLHVQPNSATIQSTGNNNRNDTGQQRERKCLENSPQPLWISLTSQRMSVASNSFTRLRYQTRKGQGNIATDSTHTLPQFKKRCWRGTTYMNTLPRRRGTVTTREVVRWLQDEF